MVVATYFEGQHGSTKKSSGKKICISHLEILKTHENTYIIYVYIIYVTYMYICKALLYPYEKWWASLAKYAYGTLTKYDLQYLSEMVCFLAILVPLYTYKNWQHVHVLVNIYRQDCVIYLHIYHNIPTKLVTCLSFEWYMSYIHSYTTAKLWMVKQPSSSPFAPIKNYY